MPILNEVAISKARYDAVAPLAEAALKTVDEGMAKLRADVAAQLPALREGTDSYYLRLRADAPKLEFVKVISESHERQMKEIDSLLDPKTDMAQTLASIKGTMDADLGWVVPRPVDDAKVAEVVARDKAQEYVEKQIVVRE